MSEIDMNKMTPELHEMVYGSTNPNDYAPGQINRELAGIRQMRSQGVLPPYRQQQPGQAQGMNLQNLLQQRDKLYQDFASAPQIRNPQQEMRYQNLQVGLGNLTKMIEQEQNREIAAQERQMKMDLVKQAQEEAQKMKREAHFDKLRKMGNAQRIAQYASGKNNAGTFTGAGGTETVPVIADKQTLPTLGALSKLVTKGKVAEAREGIEERRSGLLNLLATLPTTDESKTAVTAELSQLGNLYSEVVATEKQKLVNQGKEQVAKVKNEDKRLGKEQSNYIYGKVPRQYQVPKIDPLGNPVLDPTTNKPAYDVKTYYEEPDLPTILERYKKLGIEPPASLTGQAAPSQGAAPQQNFLGNLGNLGQFVSGFLPSAPAPAQGGQAPVATKQKLDEVRKSLPKEYSSGTADEKVVYLKRMKANNPEYSAEFDVIIAETLRGGK